MKQHEYVLRNSENGLSYWMSGGKRVRAPHLLLSTPSSLRCDANDAHLPKLRSILKHCDLSELQYGAYYVGELGEAYCVCHLIKVHEFNLSTTTTPYLSYTQNIILFNT